MPLLCFWMIYPAWFARLNEFKLSDVASMVTERPPWTVMFWTCFFFPPSVSSLMCLKDKSQKKSKSNASPTNGKCCFAEIDFSKRWNRSAEQQQFLEESLFKCYNTRLIKTANIELSLSVVFFFYFQTMIAQDIMWICWLLLPQRNVGVSLYILHLHYLISLIYGSLLIVASRLLFWSFFFIPPHQLFWAQIWNWWRGCLFSFRWIEMRPAGGEWSRSFICLMKDPVCAIRA